MLPDGEVAQLGGDSIEAAGPDLAGLFVGSEGLFGIAVEITLRLIQRPESYRTLLAGYASLQAAGDAVTQIVASGLLPGAMEIMDRLAIDAAEAAVDAGYPNGAAAILLVELEGDALEVDVEFARLTALIEASGATSTRIASDADDRARIWKGRKCAFSAVGRLSPDFIVQDGVVPRTRLGEALAAIERLSREHGIRVANVFHAGDGNLHPLILFDGREAGALERAEQLAADILRLCISLGGSITGEHGVGLEKRAFLGEMFDEADMAFMQRLRHAIDPQELANRGKMLGRRIATWHARARSAPAREGRRDLARMTAQPTTTDALQAEVLRHDTIRVRGGGTKSASETAPRSASAAERHRRLHAGRMRADRAWQARRSPTSRRALAANRQYLPFDPPLASLGATIGGTVAAGVSGPLRYRYGGVRDFVIGVRVIDGEGRSIRSGGKVVKNAAGFLLHHAMVGSQGAFGVLSEVTLKVFPRPEARATVTVDCGRARRGRRGRANAGSETVRSRGRSISTATGRCGSEWPGARRRSATRARGIRGVVGGSMLDDAEEQAWWADARDFAWATPRAAIVKIPLSGPSASTSQYRGDSDADTARRAGERRAAAALRIRAAAVVPSLRSTTRERSRPAWPRHDCAASSSAASGAGAIDRGRRAQHLRRARAPRARSAQPVPCSIRSRLASSARTATAWRARSRRACTADSVSPRVPPIACSARRWTRRAAGSC